jgi:hypothetical protein
MEATIFAHALNDVWKQRFLMDVLVCDCIGFRQELSIIGVAELVLLKA